MTQVYLEPQELYTCRGPQKKLKGEPDMFNHHAGGFHQLANLWTKYPKFHQSLPVTQAIPEKMDRLRPPIEAHTRDGY